VRAAASKGVVVACRVKRHRESDRGETRIATGSTKARVIASSNRESGRKSAATLEGPLPKEGISGR